MKAVSIFAGAGGFDLAARSVGIDVVRSVERDADCCATLAAAGFHPMQADVDDIDVWSAGLPPIDLLFGGPPCQPFSVAGKGEGGDDDRDGFPAAIEAAQALRPRWLETGRRRLTVEECAILQDFPVGYPFAGSKEAQYRQVGNAVPMRLGAAVLRAVALGGSR